jgi:hypothetical protein
MMVPLQRGRSSLDSLLSLLHKDYRSFFFIAMADFFSSSPLFF